MLRLIGARDLDRDRRLGEPDNDRSRAIPGGLRARQARGDRVHGRRVRRLLPRRGRDRARARTAGAVAGAAPGPPPELRARDRRRRGDARLRRRSCGAIATASARAEVASVNRAAARARCWAPRSPPSSCRPPFPTSPRSRRSSARASTSSARSSCWSSSTSASSLPLLAILATLTFAGPERAAGAPIGREQARGALAGGAGRARAGRRRVRDVAGRHRPGEPAPQRLRHVPRRVRHFLKP